MKTVIDTEAAIKLAETIRERTGEWLGRINEIGEQGAKLDNIQMSANPEYDFEADMERLFDLSNAALDQLRPAYVYEPENEAPSDV